MYAGLWHMAELGIFAMILSLKYHGFNLDLKV